MGGLEGGLAIGGGVTALSRAGAMADVAPAVVAAERAEGMMGVAGETALGETSAAEATAARVVQNTSGKAETAANNSIQNYLDGSGGRLGSSDTRALNDAIATHYKDQGYDVVNGAGRGKEEFVRGPGGGVKGGTYVDITIKAPDGSTIRIQTVDTLADGVTPTRRELDAAARIQAAWPDDTLILIAKPK
ncbi:MAG: hypothetical protein WDM76_09885 [Limisphaerales bacterium]